MDRFAPLPDLLATYGLDTSTAQRPTAKYAPAQPPTVEQSGRAFEFRKKAQFAWKVFTLLATFVALIPILYFQSELGAQVYLWFLVGVHILGLAVFLVGVKKEDIAPSKWGFYGRLIGLAVTGVLLFWAAKGLQTELGTAAFWWSLFLIWAIHTGGLALLHIRGKHETTCPFV